MVDNSINRRALIGGAIALGAAPAWAAASADLLDRALKAAGGRKRLARVKALNWTGLATVTAAGRTLEIQVKTRVEPFVRARSETNLLGQNAKRTLIIEPDAGYVERDGKRMPLPARQAEHERQQYGLYGYMLLALAPTRVVGNGLAAQRPNLPPVSFLMEGDYLAGADYSVADPEKDGMIAQRFILEGELRDKAIRWPQTITILQDGKPYFILDIETFSVELS